MVNPFNTVVGVEMIGACGYFSHPRTLVLDMGQLGAEVQSILGEVAGRTPAQRLVLFTFSREFRIQDGVNVCAPARPIRNEKTVAVARRCDGQGIDVVDVLRDTRTRL